MLEFPFESSRSKMSGVNATKRNDSFDCVNCLRLIKVMDRFVIFCPLKWKNFSNFLANTRLMLQTQPCR